MKARLLFVDDETDVLEGLRNRLRRRRAEWSMWFAESGNKALEILAAEAPFDIIVTDMRMPEMDGARLLGIIRDRYPGMARIMLTGHADAGAIIRATAVVHHFLAKPCDARLLENVIERVLALQSRVNDEAVRAAVGRVVDLPSRPKIYHQLLAALSDESTCASDVARIVQQDEALCARLLHIANSALFVPTRPIVRIEDTVVFLGLNTVRHLALVAEIFRFTGSIPSQMDPMVEHLHEHALLSGAIAADLMRSFKEKETGFIAALLHDVGKLVMMMALPDRITRAAAQARMDGSTLHAAERALFAITHAEIGAHLLGLWHIPFCIAEAIADHHAPGRTHRDGFDVVGVVHVANALANEVGPPLPGDSQRPAADLDLAYLEQVGVSQNLPAWREMAAKRADALKGSY